jgi:diguanylate cyclase (GGDEF)-like protein
MKGSARQMPPTDRRRASGGRAGRAALDPARPDVLAGAPAMPLIGDALSSGVTTPAWGSRDPRDAEKNLRAVTIELAIAHSRLEASNTDVASLREKLLAANAEMHELIRRQELLQAELTHRAHHDPLTGLANRTKFQDRLDRALSLSYRGVGVIWIDLDGFKKINDIFGHDAGDEMLVAVADRLREVVRDSDDIARMGGDEFAVVLVDVTEAEAAAVADRVLDALNDSSAFRLQLGASVGVSWDRRATVDGPALVRRADRAMYRAKAAGGGMAKAS